MAPALVLNRTVTMISKQALVFTQSQMGPLSLLPSSALSSWKPPLHRALGTPKQQPCAFRPSFPLLSQREWFSHKQTSQTFPLKENGCFCNSMLPAFPTVCAGDYAGSCWADQAMRLRKDPQAHVSPNSHQKSQYREEQSQPKSSHLTIPKVAPSPLDNALESSSINKLGPCVNSIRIHWQVIQGGWQTHSSPQVSATGECYRTCITGNALCLWVILHLACKWNNNSLVYGDNSPDLLPPIN